MLLMLSFAGYYLWVRKVCNHCCNPTDCIRCPLITTFGTEFKSLIVGLKRPVCCKQAEARDQEKCLKKLNEEAEQEWFHKSHSDGILSQNLASAN